MLRQEKLRERIKHPEDRFTERKPKGVSTEDICKTLVAFANSLSEGEEAVLFIGVSDTGTLLGVDNVDKMQKHVRRLAEERCYPPITIQPEILHESGISIVAITVFASRHRPHFAGPAYVRIGSESKLASKEMFEELITSRNDKGRLILQYRDQGATVLLDMRQQVYGRFRAQCKVLDCNPHFARFREEGGPGNMYSLSLDRIRISWQGQMNMPFIVED